eukprot:3436391-Rhodomonas_salina.1
MQVALVGNWREFWVLILGNIEAGHLVPQGYNSSAPLYTLPRSCTGRPSTARSCYPGSAIFEERFINETPVRALVPRCSPKGV